MTKRRSTNSIKNELVRKSREAALSAIQIYNNPLIQFKTESFIVLMIISWTYLLHAYYRSKGVEYRYFDQTPGKRRRFHRTRHNSFKHWELERCLNAPECPLDRDTKNNLRFLIQLRHQIEHQMAMGLDNYLSARYQACALNYCHYVKELFGASNDLEQVLSYSLQFSEISRQQLEGFRVDDDVPVNLRAFIARLDNELSEEEFNSPRYAYRLFLTRKTANRPGQADAAIEFIPLGSEAAESLQHHAMVAKEVERTKYRVKDIVRIIRTDGFPKFNTYHHTSLWKNEEAKNPSKGFGVLVANTWYWYESWLTYVRRHCDASEGLYR